MRALVTGAAGFIGSHLAEHLLDDDVEVTGVDRFSDYYPRSFKEANLADVRTRSGCRFVEADLAADPLEPLLDGVDVVYHLAAQPGVRRSWGDAFETYLRDNVLATERLLKACAGLDLTSFVYASSSSVYGDAETLPTAETVVPRPVSPYGVTKLAGEHLCEAYRRASGVPTASLRLFTVYGPRQRPDMALRRLVDAATSGAAFELYGDGDQTRDFTYVADVSRAMRSCAASRWRGVANIGGGVRVSMNQVVALLEELAGTAVRIERGPARSGDARHTGADTTVAREAFGYAPATGLREGLSAMIVANGARPAASPPA